MRRVLLSTVFILAASLCQSVLYAQEGTDDGEVLAAVSEVDTDYIRKYPNLNLSSALQGQAEGLIVRCNGGGLGNSGASFFVRGQHAAGTAAIVVIDGIERSIDDISAEEIGTIEVLKDAPAKVLYGPRAANGVILISTRRGEANSRLIRTTLEYGVSPSTRVPKFLGAYEYATLFNEARANDGLAPVYSGEQLSGYKNSTGENDLLYPDVDWYGKFTRNAQTYRKAVAEFIGGSSSMKYALVTSYTGGAGLEAVGKRSDLNRLNIRGNLDIRINDVITAKADVAARLELKSWGQVAESTLYSRISALRPNEYPLTIAAADLGLAENSNGVPYFGGSGSYKQNLLDDMMYGGESAERYVVSQTDIGLNFDLSRYLKGLSAEGYITLDNYSYVSQSMTKFHQTYAVEPYYNAGTLTYRTYLVRKLNENDNISIDSDLTKRTAGLWGNVSYRGSFGAGDEFSAVAAYRYYKAEAYGPNQDCITTNGTLRLDYSHDARLFAEVVLGVMGSNQLSAAHRYLFTPTAAVGYIISREPFVKVKASAGRIGYDPDSNYLLYNTTWKYPGDYAVGSTGDGIAYKTTLGTVGNYDLGWITSTEANVGAEASLLGDRLQLRADVFTELRDGGITTLGSAYSNVVGSFLKSVNYTQVRNSGLDLGADWTGTASGGDFSYKAGLNLTWAKNRVVRANEVPGIESYRSTIGRPVGAIIALQDEGLFGRDVPLASHALQTYGVYTDGDVAYVDQNKDGIIDARDETYLGKSFPTMDLGLTLDLNYRGFGLYVLGVAQAGASVMLSNNYWWNNGSGSYSVLARDRYHAADNPDGVWPRLTTTTGGNSFRDSSFWLRRADFFRLKNFELSYTLAPAGDGNWFSQCKVFIQGTNLFVLSGLKDLDPEMQNAGVGNYPVYRTLAGGVTMTF